MNYLKKYRAVFTMCIALGWWGMWFPELAVWSDAVCVVQEDMESDSVLYTEDKSEYENGRLLYAGLVHAEKDQIQVKSRLLQLIEKYFYKKE